MSPRTRARANAVDFITDENLPYDNRVAVDKAAKPPELVPMKPLIEKSEALKRKLDDFIKYYNMDMKKNRKVKNRLRHEWKQAEKEVIVQRKANKRIRKKERPHKEVLSALLREQLMTKKGVENEIAKWEYELWRFGLHRNKGTLEKAFEDQMVKCERLMKDLNAVSLKVQNHHPRGMVGWKPKNTNAWVKEEKRRFKAAMNTEVPTGNTQGKENKRALPSETDAEHQAISKKSKTLPDKTYTVVIAENDHSVL